MRNEETKKNIRYIINRCLDNCHCDADVRYDEPMKDHTAFKVGGPADVYARPCGKKFAEFCHILLKNAREAQVPLFILGGGANIVVSDNGIRGITLDTSGWTGLVSKKSRGAKKRLIFKSGTPVNEAAEIAANEGFTGLEFLSGMPGSLGGAVWMNARCYGNEMADVLEWAEIINTKHEFLRIERIYTDKNEFNYKRSPFQNMSCLISKVCLKVKKGDKESIFRAMELIKKDRQDKGHYLYPSAGSAFKNNRSFGKPTGQIIDELGLKGLSIGGAQIAPFHANFIINTGNASAKEIRALVDEVSTKVKDAFGFELEPEILFVGDY